MRVVSKIAATGRSVLCTIHQPSSDVFFYFDSMLLLRSGGRTVFFGELGHEASKLVAYFEGNKNEAGVFPKIPAESATHTRTHTLTAQLPANAASCTQNF